MGTQEQVVLLHVGAAPTASWLIQHSLLRDRPAWLREGVHGLSNAALATVVNDGTEVDASALVAEIRTACSNDGVAVVAGAREVLGPPFGGPSGSGLHADAGRALAGLEEATRPWPRKIVLSVCPPAQLVEIQYERGLRAGSSVRFADWLDGVDLANLSWRPLLQTLADMFGGDAISVVDFHATESGHTDLVQAFLGVAGRSLPAERVGHVPPPAQRLSARGLDLTLAGNPWLASPKERQDLRLFVEQHFADTDYPGRTLLAPAQLAELDDRYGEEYDGLLRLTVAGSVGGVR